MNIKEVGSYVAQIVVQENSHVERNNKKSDAGIVSQPGDVVTLSAPASLPKSVFNGEEEYNAYQGVIAQGQSDPTQLANAHVGLDPERVYRLLGLIE